MVCGANGVADRMPLDVSYWEVSRASPVHTEMRNCTRDEGGPLGAGDQKQASSRCKLLSSRAMVVSVAE